MADNTTLNTGSGGDVIATDDIASVKYQRIKLIHGADGVNDGDVSRANPFPVDLPGLVNAANSSTAPLGISASFTGTGVDVTDWASITVMVFADVASAAGGLSIEFSTDGTNWDVQDTHDIAANTGEAFIFPRIGQFFRVVYTNGGTGQATFRLETILNAWPVPATVEELDVALDSKDMAQTVRAVLAANDGTNYVNIGATAGGNLKFSLEEVDGAVIMPTAGTVAHDAVDAGNPVKVGGKAYTTLPTAAASADRVDQTMTTQGGALVAGTDGTTPRNVAVNASGQLEVDIAAQQLSPLVVTDDGTALLVDGSAVTQPVSGTVTVTHPALGGGVEAGAQRVTIANDSTGVLSVDDGGGSLSIDDGGTPLDVSAATVTVDLGANNDVIASGDVAHDAVDSGNPVKIGGKAYTTLPTAAASADRVDQTMTTQGGALVAGVDGTTPRNLAVNASGQLEVDIAAQQLSPIVTTSSNSTASGALGAVNAAVTLATDTETGSVAIEIDTGTLVGTVVCEATLDDSTWFAVNALAVGGLVSQTQVTSFPFRGHFVTSGFSQVRLRVSAYTSGTSNARLEGSAASSNVVVLGASAFVVASGDTGHDNVDSGAPVKIGAIAKEFAAEPATVSATDDRTNLIATPQGIQWVMGGHPNPVSREYRATTAQTNDDMLAAVAAGSHLVILGLTVACDNANTADLGVRIGFGTASVPAEPADGASVAGVVFAHPGIAAGSGVSMGYAGSPIGIGASDEELRITTDAAQAVKVSVLYYVATL